MGDRIFNFKLTTADVERAILLVHGEIRQIHLTAGFDCQSARKNDFVLSFIQLDMHLRPRTVTLSDEQYCNDNEYNGTEKRNSTK